MENLIENITIGKFLSAERNKQKLTLEDISESTKIKVRLLEKLEANLFDDLGGIGYAKAMILTYAKAIGVTEDQIHILLQNQFNTKLQYVAKSTKTQPRKFLLPTRFFSVMLLIFVIIVLSFLVINLYQDGVLKWPPFKKADSGLQIRPKEKVEEPLTGETKRDLPPVEEENQILKTEMIEESQVKVTLDSTDHLDKLLFKDKKSPFNYDE
ncbi:MAG: helix-turn-helix domain-containing protein [Candidatus Tenebribacter davisii]|nr:helix-turn-helix domain-containing protein [Candidatus Tenebribacter davisii]